MLPDNTTTLTPSVGRASPLIIAASATALGSINAQLKRGGEGKVNFVVIRDGGAREYEIELPGAYRLTAEVAGGIKALEGVTDVRFH